MKWPHPCLGALPGMPWTLPTQVFQACSCPKLFLITPVGVFAITVDFRFHFNQVTKILRNL